MTLKHYNDIVHKEGKNPKWHGLTQGQVNDAPLILSHPAIVIDSISRNDSIVVISNVLDSKNRPIVIAIYTNGEVEYANQMEDSNFLTSMYGRNRFFKFINNAINSNSVLYINN